MPFGGLTGDSLASRWISGSHGLSSRDFSLSIFFLSLKMRKEIYFINRQISRGEHSSSTVDSLLIFFEERKRVPHE